MWNQTARLITVIAFIGVAEASLAASQTIVLEVPGMTCAACPVTVKKALSEVAGVAQVETALDKKEVAVTFDDTKTTAKALTKVTADAGYPSTLQEGK